ncbi:DNA protection during starvation protein [Rhodobacteraceae bacterium THAF1]|uniref:DNA starvation/stationary phase protection protein Dps n=1 Tax=Palleronia sp. THAF1 TaxID=2587842 RepID=UPI000F3CC508|nr:DNA starvation/stationary phase protection protein Dps [Palleronia sp. THAF1]QFU09911.1 DNA protection during starvation protein [Palleronia sp. THAF1]VDC17186.1 DNA protection during starvation protein [Rhodobacteraceae bacterium THAF1]
MPEAFVKGLNDNTRTKTIDLLNARLADVISLAMAVKQAHWNLRGAGFIGVHELLDDVADRLRESSDLIAERAVILGGIARGTTEVVAEQTTMAAYPVEEKELQIHVEALKERFLDVGEKVRAAIGEAGEMGEDDVEDLFTEVSRQIDKDAWFIGANSPVPAS